MLCTPQALGRITPPPLHINLYAPRAPGAGTRRAGRQTPTGQAASIGVEAMLLQSLNEFHVLPGRPSVAMATLQPRNRTKTGSVSVVTVWDDWNPRQRVLAGPQEKECTGQHGLGIESWCQCTCHGGSTCRCNRGRARVSGWMRSTYSLADSPDVTQGNDSAGDGGSENHRKH